MCTVDTTLHHQVRIDISAEQLVIGLANGWTGPPPDKFLLVWPEDCGEAYRALRATDSAPRGFMFWNVADEGKVVERTDPPRTLWLARELATFLHPRKDAEVSAERAARGDQLA